MTRKELNKELQKIDIFIEVLRDFIEKPVCECILHIGSFNEQFKKDNVELLNDLREMKYFLIPLKKQSDEALDQIVYRPVSVYS